MVSSLAVIGVSVWQPGGRLGAGLDCLHPLLQAATWEHHVAGADTLGPWFPQVLLAVPNAIAKVDEQTCSRDRDSRGSSTAWLLAPSWLASQWNVARMWPATQWSKKLNHHGGLTELLAGGRGSCSILRARGVPSAPGKGKDFLSPRELPQEQGVILAQGFEEDLNFNRNKL